MDIEHRESSTELSAKLTHLVALSPRKAVSSDCNYQHDGKCCSDILAISVLAAERAKILGSNGSKHGVLCIMCRPSMVLETVSGKGESLAGED
jgi:hypothetical protein